MQLSWIKVFVFLLFLSCSSAQLNSESFNNWCFTKFENKDNFFEYLNIHEEYAKNEANVESMRLAGCAYYQKGDLDLAEQWLHEAYEKGHEGVPVDLIAIYLKEGDLERALVWKDVNTLEPTNQMRWLDIIVPLEHYIRDNRRAYLNQAKIMLKLKMQYEGETPMTSRFMEIIENLIEDENTCALSADCPVAYASEKKAYVHIFSQGVLSNMVPDIPQSWNYEEEDIGLLPSVPEEDTV